MGRMRKGSGINFLKFDPSAAADGGDEIIIYRNY